MTKLIVAFRTCANAPKNIKLPELKKKGVKFPPLIPCRHTGAAGVQLRFQNTGLISKMVYLIRTIRLGRGTGMQLTFDCKIPQV